MTTRPASGFVAPPPRELVLGGSPGESTAFPAVGALVTGDEDGAAPRFVCTGTSIAPTLVVTAAHCLVLNPYGPPRFTLATDALLPAPSVRITRTWIHPDFHIEAGLDAEPVHDLAIVELETPVDAEPERPATEAPAPDDIVRLVGYGSATLPETSERQKNAADAFVAAVRPLEIIVGTDDTSQGCPGDSGGPAFLGAPPAHRTLVALVSRAANPRTPCHGGTIMTRLDVHRAFIESVEQAAAQPNQWANGSCTAHGAHPFHRESGGAAMVGVLVACVMRKLRQRTSARRGAA